MPDVVVESAEVTVYTADAWPVLALGPVQPDQSAARELRLAGGTYRLCAQGTCTRPGAAATEAFVRWSPLFSVGAGA